jgi:hypothetical protein
MSILPNLKDINYSNCDSLNISTLPLKFINTYITLDLLLECMKNNPDNINSLFGSVSSDIQLRFFRDYLDLAYNYANTETLEKIHQLLGENNLVVPILVKSSK